MPSERIARFFSFVLVAGSGCAPAPAQPPPSPPPSGEVAPSASSPAPAPSAIPVPVATELEPSAAALQRIFEKPVRFLVAGEKGRLAVLVAESGALVPWRFEAGKWEKLSLPEAHRAAPDDPIGIFFGRDDRPRLMGFREDPKKMVYLRHKDGRWQDQRTEIGALAGDGARLYGVLGETDPEVVCRLEKLCLFKSRTGWLEAKPTIPADAVVRTFAGRGWAVTDEGLFRTAAGAKKQEGRFERVGPKAPWATKATGFWVSPDQAVVVEPAKGLVHELDVGTSAWKSTPSPLAGPRDVVGPPEARLLVGDGGAVRKESGRWKRLGAATLRFSRAIEVPGKLLLGGESGVWELGR